MVIGHGVTITMIDIKNMIPVDVYKINGGIQTVIDIARAAGVEYSAGWWGSPMFIEKPNNDNDYDALVQLINEAMGVRD